MRYTVKLRQLTQAVSSTTLRASQGETEQDRFSIETHSSSSLPACRQAGAGGILRRRVNSKPIANELIANNMPPQLIPLI